MRARVLLLIAVSAAAILCDGPDARRADLSVTPPTDAVFTSTRHVTSLLVVPSDRTRIRGADPGLRHFERRGATAPSRVRVANPAAGLVAPTIRSASGRVTQKASRPQGAFLCRTPTGWSALLTGPGRPPDSPAVPSPSLLRPVDRPDGEVWVGTMGGVLQRRRDGTWRKFTRLDGLPSHEVHALTAEGHVLTAVTPLGAAVWRGRRWHPAPTRLPHSPRPEDGQTCAAVWRGATWVATARGLYVEGAGTRRKIALPLSAGTHVSALLPHGEALWAAMFGDGLWAFDGDAWQRVEIDLPPAAREITAMSRLGAALWLGTRQDGVWECAGGKWVQHLRSDEPFDHNCQALAVFRGSLFASTLEDGLVVRTPKGWRRETSPRLSSDAPRQMVTFRGALYLRHGSGKVDRFDGRRWQRDVCAGLPRRRAMAIAADRDRLYVAQWGGWSEFDGRTWQHHLKHPELQGLSITALLPDGSRLWVGTQNRGLAEIDRATAAVRWHDERHGLPDDWVTTIAKAAPGSQLPAPGGKRTIVAGPGAGSWEPGAASPPPPALRPSLVLGTFVGGLARNEGSRWVASLSGENVTALEPDGAGGLFVGTRTGLWHWARDGSLKSLRARFPFLDPEVQALCRVDGGLWVGTRTGLYFLSDLSACSASLRLAR